MFRKLLKNYKCIVNNDERAFINKLEIYNQQLVLCFINIYKYECPCRRKNITHELYLNNKQINMRKAWKILHNITFKYPKHPTIKIKQLIHFFFNKEVIKIPCNICRQHYIQYISKKPIEQVSSIKINLINWLIDLHNEINKKNNKIIFNYKQIYNMYSYTPLKI